MDELEGKLDEWQKWYDENWETDDGEEEERSESEEDEVEDGDDDEEEAETEENQKREKKTVKFIETKEATDSDFPPLHPLPLLLLGPRRCNTAAASISSR